RRLLLHILCRPIRRIGRFVNIRSDSERNVVEIAAYVYCVLLVSCHGLALRAPTGPEEFWTLNFGQDKSWHWHPSLPLVEKPNWYISHPSANRNTNQGPRHPCSNCLGNRTSIITL
uniref:Uncharacterized protein n=1 Tax=Romanomermis culicivorax TaxID=13658 RepID=A0A915L4E8_ROMCU